jgi:transcriptional regulator with XRE-family HTH domain
MRKSIYKSDYSSFLALLIKARKEIGLTQSELAAKLNKPQSFVSKYESGERRIDVIEFIEISNVLKIAPDKIIKKIATK